MGINKFNSLKSKEMPDKKHLKTNRTKIIWIYDERMT
jgi:hypothetical protein